MTWLSRLKSVGSLALEVAVLTAIAAAFFIRAPQVSGLSMAPHITSGEIVLINTLSYRFQAPQRDDILAFHHDGVTPEVYIKRVIGIPGDRIRIERGAVFVNGARLNEPYVEYADNHSFSEVTVPANSVYVLGDNRSHSDDSRAWGFVDDSTIIGKALAGIWPLGHVGSL